MANLGDTIRNLDSVSKKARKAKRDLDGIVSPRVGFGGGGGGQRATVDMTPIVRRLAKIDRQTARGDTFQQRARKLGL